MTESDGARKKAGCAKIAGIGVAAILGLTAVGALIGPNEDLGSDVQENLNESPTDRIPPETAVQETAASSEEVGPTMTGPQRNAVRQAENYLDMKGFSREGLIEQLSSDAGDGFEVSDASVAVDSLDADWNLHAARSAEAYLSMMGFSCQGLIEQLSSDAGDGFTVEQATYGAQQAGAC